jgi:toxin CcdB
MARFDVHRAEGGLLLDVQADLLPHLKTRLVVPLFTMDEAPRPLIDTLNPVLGFDGQSLAMMTQYAAAVTLRDLGLAIGSLAGEDYAIGRALDMLLTGI